MNNYEQPVYRRQRYLLTFTGHLKDNGISRTNLQKLLFLSELYTGTAYYDFIPYKFGPYSLHMEKDIDTLCMKGFLKKSGGKIHVRRKIDFSISCSIVPERGGDLIRRVYREYLYYAVNSKILSELFSREEAEDILHRGKIIQDDSRDIIFTIGYEGRTLEAFINTLIRNGIKLLCDVRKNPASRKFGFSGKMLKRILNSAGIKYISIPALGIASEKRE